MEVIKEIHLNQNSTKVQEQHNITSPIKGGGSSGQTPAPLPTAMSLESLTNVEIDNPTQGQDLEFDATSRKWKNKTPGGGGTSNVNDVKVNGVSVVDSNKEAQIKSYKEVTQSEYNALPDSKLNDNILYAIKDVGGADSMPPLIYSDEEREVGVWRDGKPLYQKTITYNCADSSNAQTAYTIPNTHDVVHVVDAYFQNSLEQQIRYTWYKDHFWSYIILEGQYNTITVHRETNDANWQSGIKFVITIQYTKTTDVPGSGIWTPFDIVNHKVLTAYGQIVKSSNTTVAAIGSATVNLSGNLAEIDFSFKGTVGGGTSDDFDWGLSVDQLRLLNPNIPNLKPVQGGNFFCTQSNQSELVGYGAIMSPTVPSFKYWLPARIYTTSGDVGGWPSSNLYVNEYWFGRCYAEILR